MTPEQARLLPFYHDLRNEIVEPDKVVVSTQYFWTRWAPHLGPTLTVLVVCLRRHCYYNRATQERRDWCFPEQATLAREIGVESTKTIRAALRHPLARHFVRREARYTYDPKRGKKVRTSDMYYVAMDDPLTPEDEARLALRAAERLLAEGREAELAAGSGASVPPTGRKRPQIDVPPEGKTRRQVGPPTGLTFPQDSGDLFAPEVVPEESTNTTKYEGVALDPWWREALAAFAAANAAPTTPAQEARLAALAAQFDPPARRAVPPATGPAWLLAAIREAVESGSRFVAPRRIARICARWAAEGMPADATGWLAGDGLNGPGDTTPILSPLPGERGPDGSLGIESVPVETIEERGERPGDVSVPSSSPASFAIFPDLDLLSRPFWRALCAEAGPRLASPGDRKLLDGSVLLGREGQTLVVGVPGRAAAERAELRLTRVLAPLARAILRRSVDLTFVSLAEWPITDPAPDSANT